MASGTQDLREPSALGLFERWLSLWVALAIAAGLALGNITPGFFAGLAALEYASVNLPQIFIPVYSIRVWPVKTSVLRQLRHRYRRPLLTSPWRWAVKGKSLSGQGQR